MAINNFLYLEHGQIYQRHRPIILRGMNLGGWLMKEAYFLHAPNFPEHRLKKKFVRVLGKKAWDNLEQQFTLHFIQEHDIKTIASWGFNSIRLPFHYGIVEANHLDIIDQVISWAKKYHLYVLLDLHAAPGAQNKDWHSDSHGEAKLWLSKRYRHRVYDIWQQVANRYKDNTMVLGYDLLNEPVCDDIKVLKQFYRETIKAIRQVDQKHLLFIEGNRWAQEIDELVDFDDDQWVYSIHFYEPLEFTFNFIPHLSYPLGGKQGKWDKSRMHQRLERYYRFSQERQRPIHVGEFGVHYRQGHFHEDRYLKDLLACFNEFGFHWHYWTYKAIKHHMFPDGIYSYYGNPPWVNRQGPLSGWDSWIQVWPKYQQPMIASWVTKEFQVNDKLLKILMG